MRGHRLGRHSGKSSDYWPSLLLMFPSQPVESFSSLSLQKAFCSMSWLHPSSWAVTLTCSKPPGDSKQKQSLREQFLSASCVSSRRYCGCKAWCIFRSELLLPCLQRICKTPLCRKQSVVFANEKSSSPLFSSIISDLWCVQSKTNPRE